MSHHHYRKLKLWLISQDVNNHYDTYDAAIVVAETKEEARNIHPYGKWDNNSDTWAYKPEEVTVEEIGDAKFSMIPGIVLASFHAG